MWKMFVDYRILYLLLLSPLLTLICLGVGVFLMLRGEKRGRRAWLGMLLLTAAAGFGMLAAEFLLGGLFGRLGIIILSLIWLRLIWGHIRKTGSFS